MNLGLLDKSLQKQYPSLYTRSGITPPSRTVGNLGFTRSPFAEDVGQTLRFLQNRIAKPVANFTTQKVINPLSDAFTGYFGFQDVDAAIDPVKETNVSGTQALEGAGNFVTNVASKIGDVLVPTANKGEEETLKNLNNNYITTDIGEYRPPNSLMTNAQVVQQNKNNGLLNQDTETATTNQTTSLLNNQEGPSYPAKEGGYTYSEAPTKNEKIIEKITESAPQSENPNTDATPTDDNKELIPTGSFMDRLVKFSESEFGQDFFGKLLEESGPKVGKPTSTGSNIGKAFTHARDKQDERVNKNNESDFAYIVQDTANGRNYNATVDKQGNITVNVDGKKIPYKSDMFGAGTRITTVGNLGATSMTRSGFYELAQELQPLENSIQKLVKYNASVGSAPQGIEKMGLEFGAMMNTMLSKGLTPEQLVQQVNAGRFQGQIGANRLEIVGGGVMTEQDAIRIINALGGDPSSITTNPEVVNALISDIIAEKYRNYETKLAIYNSQAGTGFYSNMPKKEKITFDGKYTAYISPEALLEMNPDNISIFSEQQILNIDPTLLDTTQKQEAFIERAKELGIEV